MPRPEPSPARRRQRGSAAHAPRDRSASWIREHLDAVYRYARRRLSAADAEDVAQQAFAALFGAEAAGRAPDDAGAYLLGTARRRVADVLRRRAQGRGPVALPEGWEGYADTPLPVETLAHAELHELVHVALGLLPGSEARLLLDRYRRGEPVAALAGRLGVTAKAVEMRLRRARRGFRERFLQVGRDWVAVPDDRPAAGGASS